MLGSYDNRRPEGYGITLSGRGARTLDDQEARSSHCEETRTTQGRRQGLQKIRSQRLHIERRPGRRKVRRQGLHTVRWLSHRFFQETRMTQGQGEGTAGQEAWIQKVRRDKDNTRSGGKELRRLGG